MSTVASAANSLIEVDIDKQINLINLSRLSLPQHTVVNCIFVSPNSEFSFAQNSLVKVRAECPCSDDNTWKSPVRLAFVRVCSDSKGQEGDSQLLAGHPSLIHNLLRAKTSRQDDVIKCHIYCPSVRLRIEQCSTSDTASAKRARSIQLALSPSPHYPIGYEYKSSLFELFSTQQCLYPGDLVTVPACQTDAATHELATGTVLYYTVTEVSSGSEHLAGPILAGLEFTSLRVQAANNNYKSAVVSYAPRLYPSPSLPLATGFVNRLTTLLRRCVDASIENSLPPVTMLLHGPSGCGKAAAALAAADRLSLHVRIARCENLTVQLPGSVSSSDGSALGSASDYGEEDFSTILSGDAALPRLLLLTDVGLLARKRDGLSGADPAAVTALARLLNQTGRQQQDAPGRQPSVIIGTCQSLSQLDAGLLALFQLDLAVPPPTESERRQALLNAGASLESDAALLDSLTQRSVGFNAAELWALKRRARLLEFGYQDSAEETIDVTATRSKLTTNVEGQIRPSALSAALDATLKARAASLGASSLPTTAAVAWEDVGGQEAAVAEILATVEAPLKRPELRRHRRCGLLLYGPPGVGKTLLARAAASQLGLSFLSVKGPELVNMYVGQSEANVRALFADAIRLAPCVVFFDELDSIAPARGGGGGGGAIDRIVSQLLAELDGIRTADAAVFVIGATNRADLLDRALLRPGRFDQALLIAPAESLEDKMALFKAQLRRRTCAPDVDVETLAAALPSLVTGADVMSVVSNAADLALREAVSAIDSGSEDELSVNCCLTQAMLLSCAKELAPSVTAEQMLVYRSMQV